MEERNICLFVPFHKDYQSIHTVNFVLETKPRRAGAFRTEAVYKVHLVRTGKGFLHTVRGVFPISAGDVFFTFAGSPYFLEGGEDFTYFYVSFLGARANMVMEKLHIAAGSRFPDCAALADFWQQGLTMAESVSDLISESVLLYTFAFLGNRVSETEKKEPVGDDVFLKLKKAVDDHYNDPTLTLTSLAAALSYHPKYLSGLFKRRMGVGIAEYLNTVRVQNACTLMDEGFRSVSEIASLTGFRDALYFSKVFKKRMGVSPKGYAASRGRHLAAALRRG